MNAGGLGPMEKEDTIPDTIEEQVDDLDAACEVEHIEYEVGDHVVYPHHGAGKVIKKELKEVLGERREYLTIKLLHNDMTVMSLWRILIVRYWRFSPSTSLTSFLRTLPAPWWG